MKRKYLLAISYASKFKRKAAGVGKELERLLGQSVFFDGTNQDAIVSLDGSGKLISIFTNESEYVVLLCSAEYGESEWTEKELLAIRKNVHRSRIIPVSIDGVRPSGLPKKTFFIDCGNRQTGAQIAKKIYDHGVGKGFWRGPRDSNAVRLTESKSEKNRSGPKDLVSNQTRTGSIIVGDISGFSAVASAEMPAALDALWECARDAGLLDNHYSPILDGIVIGRSETAYRRTIEACLCWMARFKERMDSAGLQLRVAVHKGDYCQLTRTVDKTSHVLLAGLGPNECSRLVRMAGPGQIVISEDYIDSWADFEGWGPGNPQDASLFSPPYSRFERNPEPPHKVAIKPGKVSTFRFYRDNLDIEFSDPQVRRIDRAKQALEKSMKDVLDEFLEAIAEYEENTSEHDELETEVKMGDFAERVNARISLFVFQRLSPSSESLGAILRYSHSEDSFEWYGTSTRYMLFKGRGEGPVGMAFVEKVPQIITRLSDDPEEYLRELTKAPWSLPREKVLGFQRWAKGFIAVPINISTTHPPEAILCIDTMDSLSWIDRERLLEVANLISDYYSTYVAPMCQVIGF